MNVLGEMIKRERKNKGMTQKDLSEKTGITLTSIKRYEIGQRVPISKNLRLIADALGTDVSKFVGDEAARSLGYIDLLKSYIEDSSIPEEAKEVFQAMMDKSREDFYKCSDLFIDNKMKKEIMDAYNSFNLSGKEKMMAYIRFLKQDPENIQ